jgi:hypothetical protein
LRTFLCDRTWVALHAASPPVAYLPFRRISRRDGLSQIVVEDNVMLLDWPGRELRTDKRGAIPDHLAPILERLGLNRSNWVETVRGFGRLFKQAAGRSSSLVDAAARRSRRWFQGKAAVRVPPASAFPSRSSRRTEVQVASIWRSPAVPNRAGCEPIAVNGSFSPGYCQPTSRLVK